MIRSSSRRWLFWLGFLAVAALFVILLKIQVMAPRHRATPPAPSAQPDPAPMPEAGPPPAVAETTTPVAPPAQLPPAPVAMLPEQVAALVAVLASSSAGTEQAAGPLIDAAYAPLFQQLNLGAADIAQMDALLARRLDMVKAALADVAAQGLTLENNRAEITQAARDAVAPVEAEIKSLIGDGAYAQYQTYATPLRTAVITALLRARAERQG
jgi:hypothetical protein